MPSNLCKFWAGKKIELWSLDNIFWLSRPKHTQTHKSWWKKGIRWQWDSRCVFNWILSLETQWFRFYYCFAILGVCAAFRRWTPSWRSAGHSDREKLFCTERTSLQKLGRCVSFRFTIFLAELDHSKRINLCPFFLVRGPIWSYHGGQ